MVMMTIAVAIIQILSLLWMGGVLYEFRHIKRKYEALLGAVVAREEEQQERYKYVCAAVYAVATILLAGATSALFIWQPHLL